MKIEYNRHAEYCRNTCNMMKLEELLSWFDNGGAFGEDPEVVL